MMLLLILAARKGNVRSALTGFIRREWLFGRPRSRWKDQFNFWIMERDSEHLVLPRWRLFLISCFI